MLAIALLYFVLRDGAGSGADSPPLPAGEPGAVSIAPDACLVVPRRLHPGDRADRRDRRDLIGLGLWLLGVPLVFALAVLIFLGSFIPFVGATLTGLIAVLVALADGGFVTALIALGIVLGVQFVEGNFLQPIIQSRTVDLHPAVILLAVAAGGVALRDPRRLPRGADHRGRLCSARVAPRGSHLSCELRQPSAMALLSAAAVSGPTTPSAVRPFACWKATTAAAVR